MITLNLLPPEEKQAIKSQKALFKIYIFGASGFLCVLVFLVLLATVWWSLQIQLSAVGAIFEKIQQSDQNKVFNDFKKDVDDANGKLRYLYQVQSQIKNYSSVVEDLSGIIIPGIKFKNISIDGNKVVLEGYAETRDVLIAFKDKINASAYFEKLDVPLSNYLEQNEINFTFNFQIKQN